MQQSSTNDEKRTTANQRAKGGGRGIDLVVVRATGEGAQFLHKGAIPSSLYEFDISLLALCNERIGAVLLADVFPFGRDLIALQQTGEAMRGVRLIADHRRRLTPPDAVKLSASLAWNVAASTGVEWYGETWRRKVIFGR
jgi:hypothetical protein